MGTINRNIAEKVVEGMYNDDQPTKIVTYNNMFDGGLSYGLVCAHDDQMKYEDSPACFNVRVWWTKAHGLVKE